MQHSFDVEIAKEYGIIEAILLNNLEYWIAKNKANGQNFFDGYYWTYNSTRAFNQLFPYVSQRQIQNALKHLKEEGIIQTGNYNKIAYDRTLWYAFTKKGECIMQKCKMEDAQTANGNDESAQAIPDTNTNEKSNNKPKERKNEKPTYEKYVEAFTESEELQNCIFDFIKMRQFIKKPMTDRALSLLLRKLDQLSKDEKTQIQILEQSIMNNWQGIFPLKDQKQFGATGIQIKPQEEDDLAGIF